MRWLGYAVLSHLLYVVTWLIAPLLVKRATHRAGIIDNANGTGIELRLPLCLECFSTDDNSLEGDAGHKARYRGQPIDTQMVEWIRRNPNYVLERELLGASLQPGDVVRVIGNPAIRNRDQAKAGVYFCKVNSSTGTWWNLKAIVRIPFTQRCCQWEFGWKLQDIAKLGNGTRPTTASRHQIAVGFLLVIPRFTAFHPAVTPPATTPTPPASRE